MEKTAIDWGKTIISELKRLNGEFTEQRGQEARKHPRPNAAEIKLIMDFKNQCEADRLSKARIYYYLNALRQLKRYLPQQYDKCTKKDIVQCVAKINNRDCAEWTKNGQVIVIKRFFRWLALEKGEKLRRKEYPENVEWIITTIPKKEKKLPSEMINEDDVTQLLKHCKSVRDKALVMSMWDSGSRVGELISLQIKNLEFDKLGAKINVVGKTGNRQIRLVPSVPYLANWVANHPDRNNPNAWLFVCQGSNRRMTYSALDSLLYELKIRSGLKKRMNAHSFRHGRATFFAPLVSESVLKEIFGWTQSSQMAAIYVHISGDKVNEAVLRAQGIGKEEKSIPSKLVPKNCPRCRKENEATAQYCSQCSMILDELLALQVQEKELRAGKVLQKLTEKPNYTISKVTIKEVLKEMIKNREIRI